MNGAGSENLRTFVNLWEDSIAGTVEKVAGKKLAIQPSTEEAKPGIHPAELKISLGLQGAEQAEIEVALDAASTKMLGQCLLGEDPEQPAPDNPEHAEAAIELVKQIVGQVSTAAKKLVGGRELRSVETKSSDWKPGEIVSLNLALAPGRTRRVK